MAEYADGDPEAEVVSTGPYFWKIIPDQLFLADCANLDLVGGKDTNRTTLFKHYEDYYDGIQGSELLDRARQYLESIEDVEYAENICDLIVDAMADRLTIEGWSNEKGSNAVDKHVDEIWEHNNMVEVHKTSISRTVELGEGFLLVDYDEKAEMPTLVFNPPTMMKAEYDPADPQKMAYAVKRWCTNKVSYLNPEGDDIERMNIYYPDRIEQYYTPYQNGDWAEYYEVTDEYWPVPWTRNNEPNGDERGIPVFHLKNKPRGKNGGRSELHKAIPLQNSLNKLWLDLFEVADQQGFPQRYGTGVPTTDANKMKAGTGVLWSTPKEDAKFGQFEAADLNQLVNLIDTRYRTIAGTTYTPIHMLVIAKGVVTGEALKKSEAGLVSKIKDRQPQLGKQFSDAMEMCLCLVEDNGTKIEGFKYGNVPGSTTLGPVWKEAENIDESEKLETAETKRRIGVPLKIVFEELGYEDVDKMMKLVEEEREAMLKIKVSELQANRGADGQSKENADGKKPDNKSHGATQSANKKAQGAEGLGKQ